MKVKEARHNHGLVTPYRRNVLVASLLVATTIQGVVGFTGVHTSTGSGIIRLCSSPPSLGARSARATSSCLCQSVKEKTETAPLDLDLEQTSIISTTSENILADPSTSPFDAQIDDTSTEDDNNSVVEFASALYKIAPIAALLLLLSQTSIPSTAIATYSTLLVEHPLPTKSLTSGALCGVSDVIAQSRDDTRREFNFGRLIRFAG